MRIPFRRITAVLLILAVATQTFSVKVNGIELSFFSANNIFTAPFWVLSGCRVILFWGGCAVTYRMWTGRNWPDFVPRPAQFMFWFTAQVCVVLALWLLAGLDFSSIQDQVEALRADQWTAIAFVSILFAIHEEVLFRGVFQYALVAATASVLAATLVQSLLFALAHLSSPLPSLAVVAYFLFGGLWYSIIRIYTTTLWSSIGAHFGHNLVAFGIQGGIAGSYAVDGYPGAVSKFFGIAAFVFFALTLLMLLVLIWRKRGSNAPDSAIRVRPEWHYYRTHLFSDQQSNRPDSEVSPRI